MSDEVKAALKEAAPYVHDDPATALHRTRAAVAAFLRALPDWYGGDTLNLAAAVEASAHD
jgi:hypothetical protein